MFSLNSLNSLTKNIVFKKNIRPCYLPGKKMLPQHQVAERIFKLSPIHALVIYQIPWICWIYDPFRENSIDNLLWKTRLFWSVPWPPESKHVVGILFVDILCISSKAHSNLYKKYNIIVSSEICPEVVIFIRTHHGQNFVTDCLICLNYYRPPKKLREGNVFSYVCPSLCSQGWSIWPLPMMHLASLYRPPWPSSRLGT